MRSFNVQLMRRNNKLINDDIDVFFYFKDYKINSNQEFWLYKTDDKFIKHNAKKRVVLKDLKGTRLYDDIMEGLSSIPWQDCDPE